MRLPRVTTGLLLLLCASLCCAPLAAEADTMSIETLQGDLAELLSRFPEATPPETIAFALGDTLSLESGRTLTINHFETLQHFTYSAVGGVSSLTLSAKPGYLLLKLFVTVTNDSSKSLHTATLLDMTLSLGEDYTKKTQDSFFHEISADRYAGSLKTIAPRTTVSGLLLFAVPEEIDTSSERLAVHLYYGDALYECDLRPEIIEEAPGDE